MSKRTPTAAKRLLAELNKKYLTVHRRYERLFWRSYMGDRGASDEFERAQVARERFRGDERLAAAVQDALSACRGSDRKKLEQWQRFFATYQTPPAARELFTRIVALEKRILKMQATRKEGYTDPATGRFIKASRAQMQDIMSTNDDEQVRKACFEALEKLALVCTNEYVELVKLRNEYAELLGYDDFYAYKIETEENMTKQELFRIFDAIFEKTKYAFDDLREMERKQPGLRKPWNRGYLLAGDFTKEADPYYPFEDALIRWGTSFHRLGITFRGGTLQLDLLDRKGKYENGFCHWPELVHYVGRARKPGAANFTCNVVYGQVGSAEDGYNTLFHEGGHAAHLLNSTETEVCVNNEYPPASTAWAETQSMFLDSMLSSAEWSTRYAKNAKGEPYPFELIEREVTRLHKLTPLSMNGISSVMAFERAVYEEPNLTEAKLKAIAKRTYRTYTDMSIDSYRLLSIPHIYSWESSCSYQGYGLAQLAVAQWREYFYKKYGYIVDNPKVGKELARMWRYGGSGLPFPECVKQATGKRLTPAAYLKGATAGLPAMLKRIRTRIDRLKKVPERVRPVELDATIKMVHGEKVMATNKAGFERMADQYATWLSTQRTRNR